MTPKRDPRPTRATRASVAAAAEPTPPRCTCRERPQLVATFRRERLVAVEVVHWAGRDRCPMPTASIDPAAYMSPGWALLSPVNGRV